MAKITEAAGHVQALYGDLTRDATNGQMVAWILGTAFVTFLLPYILAKISGHRLPIINDGPSWDLFNIKPTIAYAKGCKQLIADGFAKFKGRPFVLNTDYKRKIILSPDYIEPINNEPSLDFHLWTRTELLAHLPSFEVFGTGGPILDTVVRQKLTQNLPKFTQPLSEEAGLALSENWGESKEWKELNVKEENLTLIARLSALVFVGPELAHNKDWQRVTVEVTTNSFIGVMECRLFPGWLQRFAAKIMPHARAAERNFKLGQTLLQPVLEKRRREKEDAAAKGVKPPYHNDALEWADQVSQTVSQHLPYEPLKLQMAIALAAIHTSTDLLTDTIYQICRHPEILQPLREEIVRVVGENGWTKTALYDLRMLDSVIKESQRMKPMGITVMNRVATKDVTLPGDVQIKKGEITMISSHRMWDDQLYPQPDEFDPWRFVKRREDPKMQHKSHLVSTSTDFTAFSHGKHACPGRFFAANEIKIALAHMIMKYDMRAVDPAATKPFIFGNTQTAPSAKLQIRRRQEEISL